MGYSINAATNENIQKSINNIYQSDSSVCNATCNAVQEGTTVNITNSTVNEGVNITQSCQAQALCNIRNTLTATTVQTQFNSQSAEAKSSGGCWGILCANFSTNISEQTVENSNTQIISNVCSANVNDLIENVTVNIAGSSVADVDFSQTGNATAACTITNVTTASVSQSQTNQQTAVSSSSDIAILLILVIGIVVVMLGLAYLNTQARKTQLEEQTKQTESLSQALQAKYQYGGATTSAETESAAIPEINANIPPGAFDNPSIGSTTSPESSNFASSMSTPLSGSASLLYPTSAF